MSSNLPSCFLLLFLRETGNLTLLFSITNLTAPGGTGRYPPSAAVKISVLESTSTAHSRKCMRMLFSGLHSDSSSPLASPTQVGNFQLYLNFISNVLTILYEELLHFVLFSIKQLYIYNLYLGLLLHVCSDTDFVPFKAKGWIESSLKTLLLMCCKKCLEDDGIVMGQVDQEGRAWVQYHPGIEHFYFNTVPTASMDPVDVLGVSEEATKREIRKAYRKLALRWHPDRWLRLVIMILCGFKILFVNHFSNICCSFYWGVGYDSRSLRYADRAQDVFATVSSAYTRLMAECSS